MTKTKRRRRSEDAQTAIIAEPVGGCGVDYGGSAKPESAANPSHVARKLAPRTTRLLTLLSTHEGSSLNEICAAFGWQPHSARAALSGLRKMGTPLERVNFAFSDDGTGSLVKGPMRYRIGHSEGVAT